MKIIPLHCLVLCDQSESLEQFPCHELIDLAAVTQRLVGSSRRHDLLPIMFGELRHQVALKLSLGERAVVATDRLSPDQQNQLAQIAHHQGAWVYVVSEQADTALGEHLHPQTSIRPVSALPLNIETHLRGEGWEGITAIGDVHGELEVLEQALGWARSRRHFVWLLGDVIDYGVHSVATARRVHQAVMHGEAGMVLGNHERKIARWLERDGENLRMSEGNRVTTDALDRLPARDRGQWVGAFRALLAHSSLTQQIGNTHFMHAAAHPSIWHAPDVAAIEHLALYGESDQAGGRYRRTHRWVDCVPAGKTVIVGHDIISEYPTLVTGTLGGKVVFLDTGCGKGGRLSSADLRFSSEGLRLECFKRY